MKELIDYKKKLKSMDIEELLDELEKQVADKEYHNFCSKNDELKEICEKKILFIKFTIIEKSSNI